MGGRVKKINNLVETDGSNGHADGGSASMSC